MHKSPRSGIAARVLVTSKEDKHQIIISHKLCRRGTVTEPVKGGMKNVKNHISVNLILAPLTIVYALCIWFLKRVLNRKRFTGPRIQICTPKAKTQLTGILVMNDSRNCPKVQSNCIQLMMLL